MADVKQIKIGDKIYNIKDYGIRPNVTECYKRLYGNDSNTVKCAHKGSFTMKAEWPRYHLYGMMLNGYGITLIGARTDIGTEHTSDTKNLEIHTVGSWDDGSNSFIIKARTLRNGTRANGFQYWGSYHTIYAGVGSTMSAGNPALIGVWGFF